MNDDQWDYQVIIPEVPNSANHPNDDIEHDSNRHMSWKRLGDYKLRWERKAKMYRGDLPNFGNKKLRVKFKFFFPVSRKRDNDNFFVAMKGMIDGFYDEDDDQHLTCDFPDFLIDKDNPRTEIFIKILQ